MQNIPHMKQPFTYYGGKQKLLPELLKLIPAHTQYVECFSGGATLFWGKQPSENEVLNDIDGRITNFYWQLQTNFEELQNLIRATLHSEILYKESKVVLEDANETPVRRAWALWVQTSMTFSSMIHGGFAFGTTGCGDTTANRRDRFEVHLSHRLQKVEIFSRTATDLIKLKDTPSTFFYCDPPYVSSQQGHYEGYTEADFINLLNALQNIQGKFLLSSYPEKILLQYREDMGVDKMGEERGWRWKDMESRVFVTGKREGDKKKIECLTWNFEEPSQQGMLFETEEMEGDMGSLAERAEELLTEKDKELPAEQTGASATDNNQ